MQKTPKAVYVVVYENEMRLHRESYFSKGRASDFPGQYASITEYLPAIPSPSPSPDLQGELVAVLRGFVATEMLWLPHPSTVDAEHEEEVAAMYEHFARVKAVLAKVPAEVTTTKKES